MLMRYGYDGYGDSLWMRWAWGFTMDAMGLGMFYRWDRASIVMHYGCDAYGHII